MAKKFKFLCTKCPEYSFGLRRCTLGKINPKTIKAGCEAARFMGVDYICNKCSLKLKIRNKLYEESEQV